MEFFILLAVIVVLFTFYVMIVNVGVRLLRALFGLPQKKNVSPGWPLPEDFLFGKPLNRYERRERKGRIREWR